MTKQNEERARAVKLARKFMNMTMCNGASESETEAAMKRLSDIRQTFNLTLDEIVLETLDYRQVDVEATTLKGDPMRNVIVAIGNFTDTKVWRQPGQTTYQRFFDRRGRVNYRRVASGNDKYMFFGIDTDTEMAVYVYDVIARALNTAEKKFMRSGDYTNISYRGGKRMALVSFRKGFIQRLNHRLYELKTNEDRAVNEATTGSDIVLMKDKARENKFEEMIGLRLVKGKRYERGITNYNASSAGREAANNVSFDRPVGNSSSNLKLIGA